MSIFAALTTVIFLPAQFYFAGLFLKPPIQSTSPVEKVEGATDSKDPTGDKSFKKQSPIQQKMTQLSKNQDSFPKEKRIMPTPKFSPDLPLSLMLIPGRFCIMTKDATICQLPHSPRL